MSPPIIQIRRKIKDRTSRTVINAVVSAVINRRIRFPLVEILELLTVNSSIIRRGSEVRSMNNMDLEFYCLSSFGNLNSFIAFLVEGVAEMFLRLGFAMNKEDLFDATFFLTTDIVEHLVVVGMAGE